MKLTVRLQPPNSDSPIGCYELPDPQGYSNDRIKEPSIANRGLCNSFSTLRANSPKPSGLLH